jgi:hypothetical protein
MYGALVDELFERLPPLAALTGWERDRLKLEAQRVLELLIDEPDGEWDGD